MQFQPGDKVKWAIGRNSSKRNPQPIFIKGLQTVVRYVEGRCDKDGDFGEPPDPAPPRG